MKDSWKTFGAVFSFLLLLGVLVYVNVIPDNPLNKPLPSFAEVKEGSISVYRRVFGGGEKEVIKPLEIFQTNQEVLGGWQVRKDDVIYTTYTEKRLIRSEGVLKTYQVITYPNPEWVIEDNQLKNKIDAKSLKGYYEPVRLLDDKVHDMEYVDWNWTSVTFKVNVKDSKELNKDIPLKVDGLQVTSARLSLINEPSNVITLQHNRGNWSFGSSTTTDGWISSSDNSSFGDAYLWKGYPTGNTGGYATMRSDRNGGQTYGGLGLIYINLRLILNEVTISSIDDCSFTHTLSGIATGDTPLIVTWYNVKTTWSEGLSTDISISNENASWISPRDNFLSDDAWTDSGADPASTIGTQLKSAYKGDTLNITSTFVGAGQRAFIQFNPTACLEMYNNNYSFGFNVSDDTSEHSYRIYTRESGGNEWTFNMTYTAYTNTPPSCTQSNTNITVDEDSGSWTLDANMSQALNISCTDIDNDALTYSIDSQSGDGGTFSLVTNDVLNFATDSNESGTSIVVIDVSDGIDSVKVSAQVIVTTINDGPWWESNYTNDTFSINENEGNQYVTNLSEYFRDVEEDKSPALIEITNNNTNVTCSLTSLSILSCNPDGNITGNSIMTITETDSGALTITESFELTINAINDKPWWDIISNSTTPIKTHYGLQPINDNLSVYFHDIEDGDFIPYNITIMTNNTNLWCGIETNFSLFCNPLNNFIGDYIITINGSDSGWESVLTSFENKVENSAPSIPNFISPEDHALNDTNILIINCSGGIDIDSPTIVYDYYGSNSLTTVYDTLVCSGITDACSWIPTISNTWLYWTCASNDTLNSSEPLTPRSIRAETWDIINQTQSYNEFLISSSNIILESNVTWNEIRYTDINALVNLSETFYTVTKTSYDNYTNFKVNIPFNQTIENPQGFTWNYTLTYHNLTLFENSTTYGGSIPFFNLNLMNCSDTNISILLNVTGFHEDTNELLGISLEGIFEIWIDNYEFRNIQTFDLNSTDYNVTGGIDSYYFCLSYDTPVNLSAYMQYSTPGGFVQRWYINRQTYQNNTNNEIHLYDRDYTSGISDLKGTIRYKDSYSYFQNVYTQLYRYYPADNLWTYVQSDKSDEFGLVHFNIKEIENDYRLLFYDGDNHLLLQTTSSKFACDPTTNICEITFLLDAWSEGTITYKTPLTWTYDNATGIISVTWNDPTSTISSLRVLVTKETMGGTTTVCDGTTASASGTYTCNVSAYDGQLLLRAYQTASPEGNPLIYEWITRPINKLFQFLPLKESVVWAVSLSVTTAIFGIIISPAAGIIMFITSLVIISMLGLAGFVTIGFITFAVILGVIIGLKVRS